jgi:hypothetical protein
MVRIIWLRWKSMLLLETGGGSGAVLQYPSASGCPRLPRKHKQLTHKARFLHPHVGVGVV